MNTRVQCGVTAGLAIVGASVIAVAPLTTATPMAQGSHEVTASVDLAAAANPLDVLAGFAETGQNAAGAVALSPLTPALAGIALAAGDNQRAYSIIRQAIDAPLWAADPSINALAKVLPAPIGGGTADKTPGANDGALVQFRDDVLWAATNALRTPIKDALGAQEPPASQNYAGDLGAGLAESGLRTVEGAALVPLGLIPIAQAIATGDKEDLYIAVRQYIDGPLWAADPTINGLAKALPAPLGGGTADNSGNRPGDGAVVQFRDNVLWAATNQTRTAVANALDVDPSLPHTTMLASTSTAAKQSLTADNGNVGKFTPGSPNAVGANKTDSPRPVATAVKAINNQLKETAEHLGQAAKKLSGADDSKNDTGTGGN